MDRERDNDDDRLMAKFLKRKHKFVVSSSLSSVFTSANVIVATAASGSSSLHSTVTSTLTHVAVTPVAIASGACLSTKVDFLWPKLDDQWLKVASDKGG